MRGEDPRRFIFKPDFDAYKAFVVEENKRSIMGPYIKRSGDGWIMFGPQSVRAQKRGNVYALECRPLGRREKRELHIRIRAGCRYYSLAQAWRHWGQRKRGQGTTRKNHCAQAVNIIRLMLLQAQEYGLLSLYAGPIKFDSSLVKRKRR